MRFHELFFQAINVIYKQEKMHASLVAVALLLSVGLIRGDPVQQLSSASSGFSQKLYQKIAQGKPNAVYSPYSIHSALTMTSLGARGDTAMELSQTLGLTALTGTSPHQAYHDLIVQMNNVEHVKLNTANGIFINPNMPIEDQFINDVKADYLASVANFDMAAQGGPEKPINDYVKDKTEGLIKDILPAGTIDSSTVMILVNSIFFNGTWETQFDKYSTSKQDFHQLGGAKSQVDMMYDEREVNVKRNIQGVDVAELPFRGKRFSLYIALPQAVDGITALENLLATPGNVDQLFEGLSPIRVKLSIPKFKIESSYELKSALQQMGIKKAFDPMSADFKGISSDDVYLSQALHKAMIEVKETGTVAAAATAISAVEQSEHPTYGSFKADHSFIFFLRDTTTKEIFFQGKFSG